MTETTVETGETRRGGLGRLVRDVTGAATIEFALVAPLIFAIFFSVLEAGILMTRTVMLERAVSLTVRDLRIDNIDSSLLNEEGLKQVVCNRAIVFADCTQSIALDLVPLGDSFGASLANQIATETSCVDRTATDPNPVVTVDPGSRTENMFVRVCVVVDPILPGIGLGLRLPKDASGGVRISTFSAFRNEPE